MTGSTPPPATATTTSTTALLLSKPRDVRAVLAISRPGGRWFVPGYERDDDVLLHGVIGSEQRILVGGSKGSSCATLAVEGDGSKVTIAGDIVATKRVMVSGGIELFLQKSLVASGPTAEEMRTPQMPPELCTTAAAAGQWASNLSYDISLEVPQLRDAASWSSNTTSEIRAILEGLSNASYGAFYLAHSASNASHNLAAMAAAAAASTNSPSDPLLLQQLSSRIEGVQSYASTKAEEMRGLTSNLSNALGSNLLWGSNAAGTAAMAAHAATVDASGARVVATWASNSASTASGMAASAFNAAFTSSHAAAYGSNSSRWASNVAGWTSNVLASSLAKSAWTGGCNICHVARMACYASNAVHGVGLAASNAVLAARSAGDFARRAMDKAAWGSNAMGQLTFAAVPGDVATVSDASLLFDVDRLGGDPLEALAALKGYTYVRSSNNNNDKRVAGLLAHEVLQAIPEAVFENATGNGGAAAVAYSGVVTLLVEAVNQLHGMVRSLSAAVVAS